MWMFAVVDFQISALDVFLRRWIVSCLQLFPLNVSDWNSTSTLLPHQRISVKCFLCLLCRIFVLVLLIYCTNAFTGKPLDFSVECFIWLHLHCTTCFTKVYRLPCVVFFSLISCLPSATVHGICPPNFKLWSSGSD